MAVMKMPSTSRGVFQRRGSFGEMVSFGSIPGGLLSRELRTFMA